MKERITFFCTLLLVNSSFAITPNIVIIVTDDQGWGDVGYHTAAGQVPILHLTWTAF
jgi:arylsulfatase A-like enzyme